MANTSLTKEIIEELLKLNPDSTLFHREKTTLEFKEQFNWSGIAEYLKDFAAFANNSGGYLVFGVKDSPRILTGMSAKAVASFNKIDPQQMTGHILEHFSSNIDYDFATFEVDNKIFGVFYVEESKNKPIIAKKDAGDSFKNADIHYRYGGRTQKIQHSELEAIISRRVEDANNQWRNYLIDSAKIEPSKAHILTSQTSVIGKDNNILYIDQATANKINFLKKGEFKETAGEKAIMLIGEAEMIKGETIEKEVTKSLIESYPLTCTELINSIQEKLPDARQGDIYKIIKEDNIKEQKEYSAYHFRSKKQEKDYQKGDITNKGIQSIYNENAVEYIVKILENESK